MSDQPKYPRLGDREGLRIDIMPSAAQSYREGVRMAFARATVQRTLTEQESHEQLLDVLRQSSVRYSSDSNMRVRARVRRLAVDVEAELVRVAPDHVRCIHAQVRRLDTRGGASGSGRGGAAYDEHAIKNPNGRGRLGYLRAADGKVEWRHIAPGDGAAPLPWGPVTSDVVALALDQERNGHPATARWLREHGAALEPPPKKASGENIEAWQRNTESVFLRVPKAVHAQIVLAAKADELTPQRWILRLIEQALVIR